MYSARNALLVASVLAGCSLSGPKDATSLVEVAPGESLVAVENDYGDIRRCEWQNGTNDL